VEESTRPRAHPVRERGGCFGASLAGWLFASLFGCDEARLGAPGAATTSVPACVSAASTGGTTTAPNSLPRPAAPSGDRSNSPLPGFADLVARAKPAVAQLLITEASRRGGGRATTRDAVGCAFVCDSESHLLTNHHVIANAQSIAVVFGDEAPLPARIVGTDPPTDLAVLEVSKPGLPSLPLGDSESMRVGDWVVAIGNPFGLSHTVSVGILSAKGRGSAELALGDESHYFDFLQTDASINPGNSGGPLLDLSGRVVGIATKMRSLANGIGFAIPIDMAKQLLPTLLAEGRIRRSSLGLRVEGLNGEERRALGLAAPGGAIVRDLEPGGPAELARVLPGDVVVELGGESIRSAEHLRWVASLAGVGRTTQVVVHRSGRRVALGVTMGELVLPPTPKQPDSTVSPQLP